MPGRSRRVSKPPTKRGIVHRDLKPANIKVTHDGIVKLLDLVCLAHFKLPLHPYPPGFEVSADGQRGLVLDHLE